MDLELARARIAELEGQVTTLTGERETLTGEREALNAQLAEATGAHATASDDLAQTRSALAAATGRELAHLRRALLAEHAGQVVPELVSGDDEATLLASVELAQHAYARALEAARTTIATRTVPAGAPSARNVPATGLSPLEMIESGLRR